MLEKTINKVLKKKVDEWVNSISDTNVRKVIRQNVIITGGAITSLVNNDEPNDYDVYFKDKHSAKVVAEHYVDKFNYHHENTKVFLIDNDDIVIDKELNVIAVNSDRMQKFLDKMNIDTKEGVTEAMYDKWFKDDRLRIYVASSGEAKTQFSEDNPNTNPYHAQYLTSNAITLSEGIQIIIRFWGDVDTIHENFDFAHCKGAWTYSNGKCRITAKTYEAIINKTLMYEGSKYPVCSIIRLRKFIGRGFTINAGEILKMVLQCGDLDLTDPKVMEEQLVGVDTAYFLQLIDRVRNSEDISTTHLCTIIDELFNDKKED